MNDLTAACVLTSPTSLVLEHVVHHDDCQQLQCDAAGAPATSVVGRSLCLKSRDFKYGADFFQSFSIPSTCSIPSRRSSEVREERLFFESMVCHPTIRPPHDTGDCFSSQTQQNASEGVHAESLVAQATSILLQPDPYVKADQTHIVATSWARHQLNVGVRSSVQLPDRPKRHDSKVGCS